MTEAMRHILFSIAECFPVKNSNQEERGEEQDQDEDYYAEVF